METKQDGLHLLYSIFSQCQQTPAKKQKQWIDPRTKLLKTHHWPTLLRGVTYSFSTNKLQHNTHTIVSFNVDMLNLLTNSCLFRFPYGVTLSFIWSCVSDQLINVSATVTLFYLCFGLHRFLEKISGSEAATMFTSWLVTLSVCCLMLDR